MFDYFGEYDPIENREPYRQCKLVKTTSTGVLHQTSWLPDEFAIVGGFVKLLNSKSGIWTDGWKVTSIGPIRKYREVVSLSEQHKNFVPNTRKRNKVRN